MRIKTIIGILILIAFTSINVDLAFSQYDDEMLKQMEADEELEQELKWLKAETYVFTASKVMENIKKAPASITVRCTYNSVAMPTAQSIRGRSVLRWSRNDSVSIRPAA